MKRRQRLRLTLIFSFFLLFPITFNYYSPALPMMGLAEGVICFSLLFWSVWLVASIWLGRSACGWFCPLAGLQVMWDFAIMRPLVKLRNLSITKYLIFALWIWAMLAAYLSSDGFTRIDLLYNTEHIVSWDGWDRVFIYAGMFGLVMLISLPLGKRAFCHYLCWWAPLNILGSKAGRALRTSQLQLVSRPDACIDCGKCTKNCEMSLPVQWMVQSGEMYRTECILCGNCVDNCGESAINYGWRKKDWKR